MFRWWWLSVCLVLAACSGSDLPEDVPPGSDSGTSIPSPDAGGDAGTDGGLPDAGADGGIPDAGFDAGAQDAGSDGGQGDAGSDGGAQDAGTDGGRDGGSDAGCVRCESPPPPSCYDAKTIVTWFLPGYCGSDGGCQYSSLYESCQYGCSNDACQPCPPQCDGRECGDDGCGGSCGTCDDPQSCGGGGLAGICGPELGCGSWSVGASLQVARAHPAAAMLSDGRLFLAGGLTGSGATRTAEAFNPGTNTWTSQGSIPDGGTTPGGASNSFYSFPGAAQLGTGKVLVTGYADNAYARFDPATATWTPGSGITTRLQPLVLPLANGQALVASGITEGGDRVLLSYTYDDVAAKWNYSTSREGRYRAAGVQLADGRVMVTSGIADDVYGQAARSAELYDPVTNTWSYTGAPRRPHAAAALARLQDGRVLLIGGTSVRGFFTGTAVRSTSVELYDPATGLWRDTGFLNVARSGHTATVLADGRVLVAGGVGADGKVIPWVELYDVETERWTLTAPLSTARTSHVATQLEDGRVLVTSGTSPTGAALASTEVVQPAGFCPAHGCVPESDDALCARQEAGCGTLSVQDACGTTRQVSCGQCSLASSCGGAGIPYRCGAPGGAGWQVETLGTAGGRRPGIVIEANGEPAVAYLWYDVGGGGGFTYEVFLARRHSQGWSAAPIQGGVLSSNVALARTSTGQLRAAATMRVYIYSSSNEVPTLLSWDAGRWRDEVAAPTYPVVNASQLAMGLGPTNEPLVCTIDLVNYFHTAELLCYARDDSGEWRRDRVDAPGSYGGAPSVAVGRDGIPHLAYYDMNKKALIHAVKGDTGWTLETVDASADVGRDASLALDAQGHPHIAYRDATNKDLKYARWTGSAWSLQQVDTADDVGGTPALALDAQGRPHISYEDLTRHNLKYARWSGTAWELTTVDASGVGGANSALTLDASGRAHIAYYGQDLRYARGP
ncbi:hypothetical protein COCOR_02296 [Corallococcus coralloides DSM 2259]|uniref:Kelch domain-containing protein n=1 Tax=Corallococcus coralloides (strain ATCC 25202 / DSM 2259 / NBRC 100086 / M2) TaxID=1144275 RepID=H8MLU8_CORCM|nr:kelch repeat-containing protein [Corallococcus coralloides]AFE04585.1 hypothetical protein COCOR_02296 [Corallococcus coralloides DSM 2259]